MIDDHGQWPTSFEILADSQCTADQRLRDRRCLRRCRSSVNMIRKHNGYGEQSLMNTYVSNFHRIHIFMEIVKIDNSCKNMKNRS